MARKTIPFVCGLVLSLTCICSRSLKYEDDDKIESLRLQKGKEKLDELTTSAQYSPCWAKALDNLHGSCRFMSDDDQRRLALSFANCHFKSSNRKTYPCPTDSDIAECTSNSNMDDAAFQVYTEFFTHTGNICFFVQNRIWQERTEGTINKLSDVSNKTVEKLEESLEYHRQLEEKQAEALKNQEAIIEQDAKISVSLTNTRADMNEAFQEMYEKAESQKVLLNEVFDALNSGCDSIKWILSSILGEIITLETAGFFVIAMAVIAFLPQFGTSRLWLYGTLLGYGVLEGIIKRFFFVVVDTSKPDSMALLYTCLWYPRWAACILLCAVFFWRYLVFTGHERKQVTLLEDMSKQLDYIQQSLPCTPVRPHPQKYFNGDEGTDSSPVHANESGSSSMPPTPLKDLYQAENQGSNIVSGTQLVDFLSCIYMNNVQADIEVQTTTDNTYQPPPSSLLSTIASDTDSHEDSYSDREKRGDGGQDGIGGLARRSLTREIQHTDNEDPLFVPPVSSNDSLISNCSTMSLTLEKCRHPRRTRSPSHCNERGNKASSVARDDPSNDVRYMRESTPIAKGNASRQRKSNNTNEDDDSGFSTDGSHMTRRRIGNLAASSTGGRYNLRPRRK